VPSFIPVGVDELVDELSLVSDLVGRAVCGPEGVTFLDESVNLCCDARRVVYMPPGGDSMFGCFD